MYASEIGSHDVCDFAMNHGRFSQVADIQLKIQ